MNERLDRTQELPTEKTPIVPRPRSGFQPGKAAVREKRPDPTLTMRHVGPQPGQIVTSGQLKRPAIPLRARLRMLRTGGGWSVGGALVLLVCWALWAADAGVPVIAQSSLVLLLILGVAVGLFGLARLVGGIVLEKLLSRTRRGAILSHMAIGLFLALVGISLLRQVDWVVEAWNHLSGNR